MLSPAAQKVIQDYLSLPFRKLPGVECPYYNNRHAKLRGALRVLAGKGSPEDIAEEAMIISLKEKVDLKKFSADELKRFLVDNKIGIDCSGLAYYILDAELKFRGKPGLARALRFPNIKNVIRKFLARLRTVENTSVKVLAEDANSRVVGPSEIAPGDIICMLNTGPQHDYDHVLVVHDVEKSEQPVIHYTHAIQWSSDGSYKHGVRQGKITITNPALGLVDQRWEEQGKTGGDNETFFLRAKTAENLEIRRLNSLR